MESGDDALLRFLRKPGSAADVIDAVGTLKAAGVAVSVIIMAGVGGERLAEGHVRHTVEALLLMPFGPGDIIYFSPFFEQPGSEYGALARQAGIRPLSTDETARQEAVMRAALAYANRGGIERWGAERTRAPQLAHYDIREFVY
jgi:hypothetical protein